MIFDDAKERKLAWIMLIACPLSMLLLYSYVTAGLAPGLAAGHPIEYLQTTCLMWMILVLILPILRLIRMIALPLWFVVLIYCDMYLYPLSLCQGWYLDIWWWGDVTHVISAMVVTSIVFMALCLVHARAPSHVSLGSKFGIIAMLLVIGCSFGTIWEVMEGYTDILTGAEYMSYGALDTLGDLNADILGVILMTAMVSALLAKQDPKVIASRIRLGKNSIDVR